MNPLLNLPELERRYLHYQSDSAYEDLCARVLPTIVDWRWATYAMFHFEPFWAYKGEFPEDKWLVKGKADSFCHYEHGFSAAGDIVFIRHNSRFPAGVRTDETYIIHEGDSKTMMAYEQLSQRRLTMISMGQYHGGHLVSVAGLGELGTRFQETFSYSGERLFESTVLSEEREYVPHGLSNVTLRQVGVRYRYSYDEFGRLMRIECNNINPNTIEDLNEVEVRWERPQKDITLRNLSPVIEEALRNEILARLKGLNLREQVCCVLLVYDTENGPLPPMLAVGTDLERKAFQEKYGKKASGYMWNPAELKLFNCKDLELIQPELIGACRTFCSLLWQKNDIQPARKLLNQVAAGLMAFDWAKVFPTSDDFAVIAVDLETQADLLRNARASLGEDKVKWLRSRQLL